MYTSAGRVLQNTCSSRKQIFGNLFHITKREKKQNPRAFCFLLVFVTIKDILPVVLIHAANKMSCWISSYSCGKPYFSCTAIRFIKTCLKSDYFGRVKGYRSLLLWCGVFKGPHLRLFHAMVLAVACVSTTVWCSLL